MVSIRPLVADRRDRWVNVWFTKLVTAPANAAELPWAPALAVTGAVAVALAAAAATWHRVDNHPEGWPNRRAQWRLSGATSENC